MALVMQRLLSRRSTANDGELASSELPEATSSWCVLACSADTEEIGADSEDFLGKKVLEPQCSPQIFDPDTRSELLRALCDSSAPSAEATAESARRAESSHSTPGLAGGLGGSSPSTVQVHTMGESLAVIAPAKYVSGGRPNSEPREVSRLLRDIAVEGGTASSSREQVAVEKVRLPFCFRRGKCEWSSGVAFALLVSDPSLVGSLLLQARALTGYDRVLYCRCLALPAFEFDVVEVLAESASSDFRSQSAAAFTVGQTALLREIVDGVEGEARNGGLSGKLVVPVFRRLPFQPLSLEGLLICHRYGFPSSQLTVMSREARMALDFLAASLSANAEDEYLWYASRAINGSFRVLQKSFMPDSVSLQVKYSGHSWQGNAWGTADVEPGKPVTFADVLVEAYNNASAAVKELMPKDPPASPNPSVLYQSAPVILLDVGSDAPELKKKEPAQRSHSNPFIYAPRKFPTQPQLGHRHISNITVLKQITNASSVSLLIEGCSQNLTAKAWGTAHFSKSQDQDDAYLEAYDKASATLKELLPPKTVSFDFPDDPAAAFASSSTSGMSLLQPIGLPLSRSSSSGEMSDLSIFASLPVIPLMPLVDIPAPLTKRSSDNGGGYGFFAEAEKQPRHSASEWEETNGMRASDVRFGSRTGGCRPRTHNGEMTTSPSEFTGDEEKDDSENICFRMDMGAVRRNQRQNSMSIFRNLVKQLRDCPSKNLEPAVDPAAPVAQSDELPPKALDNVLVVDDDLVNVKMIQRVLVKKGLQVTGKEDGQDIMDLCINNGQRFDMILVDENMRHMNGSAAIEHLRRHEKTMGLQPTPVIVTTANTSSQDMARYSECGMDGILAKPINMRQLPVALEDYFTHLQANEGERAAASEPCKTASGMRMFHEIAIFGDHLNQSRDAAVKV